MKKQLFIISTLLITCPLFLFSQANTAPLTPGAVLLFKNSNSKFTNQEKNWLFTETKLQVSKDKKGFKMDEYEVIATAYITDINKDGAEEVFIVLQSGALYGNTGEDFMLYIKNNSGMLQRQDIGGGLAMIFTSNKANAYPDIAVGGPGFEFALYKWNGKKYAYSKKITDAAIQQNKLQYQLPADCGAAYAATLKKAG
ncbi:MAG: hypothetical protein RL172_1081 [Bacteroidota bacterium]|jgi:hypothetical protein